MPRYSIPPMLHFQLSSGAGTISPFKDTVPRDSVRPNSYNLTDNAENTVLLLHSTEHTENKSCDSYLASPLAH